MTATITHRVGDVPVTRIQEQVGLGFTPEQLYPEWEEAVLGDMGEDLASACFDRTERRFIASIHSWLLTLGERRVLVDTCVGNDKDRLGLPRFHMQSGPYLARLAAAGVDPAEVDFVMCTHLHADHCGWNTRLVDGRWVPTFPNARYVFSRAEADHWSTVGAKNPLGSLVYNDSVLPVVEAGRAEIVTGDEELLRGLRLHPTPGHTIGHLAILLESAGERGLFAGDIMHQPMQVYRPGWNSAFCEDGEAAKRSRRWALEEAAETGATLFTAHFPQASAGRVLNHGEGFQWRFGAGRA